MCNKKFIRALFVLGGAFGSMTGLAIGAEQDLNKMAQDYLKGHLSSSQLSQLSRESRAAMQDIVDDLQADSIRKYGNEH